MRHVSLREFRTRGAKALAEVKPGETALLVGQGGPAYFLVPVVGDVVQEDRELRRALAKTSMREGWLAANEGEPISDEEIEQEIQIVRAARRQRQA